MAFDDKSEIIAHFIGIFETNSEAVRLRSDYDAFRAEAKKTDGPGPFMNINVKVTSPYSEGGFNPETNNAVYGSSAQIHIKSPTHLPHEAALKALNSQSIALGTLPNLPLSAQVGGFAAYSLDFTLLPPSSVATVNIQYNFLTDDDVFSNVDTGIEFTDPAVYHTALTALASTAQTLQIVEIPDLPQDGDTIAQDALEAVETLASLSAPEMDGATVDLIHGQDATGIIENGTATDQTSSLKDALPHTPPETGDSGTGTGTPPQDDGPAHTVNTGGSTLLNQTTIISYWLDAPVIAVMGDYVSVTAIGQLNAWNDTDTTSIATPDAPFSTTTGINTSSISAVANAVAATGYTGGPGHVVVTRIEGDVINLNYVQQYNFAYDNDVVSVTFSASETYLELSDNTLVNLTSLEELGYQYDLIVIGGSMIDLRVITQTNVLLDTDSIHVQGNFAGNIESNGNLLWNQALIYQSGVDTIEEMPDHYATTATLLEDGAETVTGGVLNDNLLDGTQVLRVLYVSGDVLDVQAVQQVNVLGDADQVALLSETVQGADGANIAILTGENALINVASIMDLGVDSTIYVGGEQYSDALLYQAGFVSTEDPALVSDTSGLASEAVLFLTDDMIDAPAIGGESDMAPFISTEPPADVMQSVLA